MIRLVPVSDANCQYENVRRKIAWSTLGGMTRFEMKIGLRNEQHQDETKPWYLIAVPTRGSSLKSCRGSVVTGAVRRVAIVRDCVRATRALDFHPVAFRSGSVRHTRLLRDNSFEAH